MRTMFIISICLTLNLCSNKVEAQMLDVNEMVNAINEVRNSGCKCGKRYYQPVAKVTWNDTLYMSAENYATYMSDTKFFAHVGPNGKNIGERVDKFGYDWQFIGENLGKGQKDIAELIDDWKKSFTHCKLLMDPRFKEMGLAAIKGHWVLHLGKKNSKENIENTKSSK